VDTEEDRAMSRHLNHDQTHIWQDALAAVQETAANTDHESSSRQPLLTLVEHVALSPKPSCAREISRLLA
jgi:hypothetical protein